MNKLRTFIINQAEKTLTSVEGKIAIQKFDNKVTKLKFNTDDNLSGRIYIALLNPQTKRNMVIPLDTDNEFIIGTSITRYTGVWTILLLSTESEIVNENIEQSKLTYVTNEAKFLLVRDNFLEDASDEEQVEPNLQILYDQIVTARDDLINYSNIALESSSSALDSKDTTKEYMDSVSTMKTSVEKSQKAVNEDFESSQQIKIDVTTMQKNVKTMKSDTNSYMNSVNASEKHVTDMEIDVNTNLTEVKRLHDIVNEKTTTTIDKSDIADKKATEAKESAALSQNYSNKAEADKNLVSQMKNDVIDLNNNVNTKSKNVDDKNDNVNERHSSIVSMTQKNEEMFNTVKIESANTKLNADKAKVSSEEAVSAKNTSVEQATIAINQAETSTTNKNETEQLKQSVDESKQVILHSKDEVLQAEQRVIELMSTDTRSYFFSTIKQRDAEQNIRHCDRCSVLETRADYIYDMQDTDGDLVNPEWIKTTDWDALKSVAWSIIVGKPNFAKIATTASYNDLVDVPNRYQAPQILDNTIDEITLDFSISDTALVTLTEPKRLNIINDYNGAVICIHCYGNQLDFSDTTKYRKSVMFNYLEALADEHMCYTLIKEGTVYEVTCMPYKGGEIIE